MVVLLALVSNGQDEHARRAGNFIEHDVTRVPKGNDQLAPRLALANFPEAVRRHSQLDPDRRLTAAIDACAISRSPLSASGRAGNR